MPDAGGPADPLEYVDGDRKVVRPPDLQQPSSERDLRALRIEAKSAGRVRQLGRVGIGGWRGGGGGAGVGIPAALPCVPRTVGGVALHGGQGVGRMEAQGLVGVRVRGPYDGGVDVAVEGVGGGDGDRGLCAVGGGGLRGVGEGEAGGLKGGEGGAVGGGGGVERGGYWKVG